MRLINIFVPLALLTASCSDSDSPAFTPTLPATTGSKVISISRNGTFESGYDWTFRYQNNRLTQANGTLRAPEVSQDRTFSYTCTLSYNHTGVSARYSNSSIEPMTFKMGSNGYICRITQGRNSIDFQYNADGRLSAWQKTTYEGAFGQTAQYTSSATISYDTSGSYRSITYMGTDSRRTIVNITPSAQPNVNGLLPPTLSTELGMSGYEHLYYAGLLGRASTLLPQQLTRDYPDASSRESSIVTYEYGLQSGNVTLCYYHPTPTTIASVAYSY